MPPTEASQPLVAKIEAAGLPTLPLSVEERGPSGEGPAAAAVCANCGTALQGPFCSQCGQHVADYHRSLWRFLGEFFDNTICWDNKALRTLGPLLTQPGVLTREFMAGRRVRYVQPLRLFLFVSAVCLTLLQFSHTEFGKIHVDRSKKKSGPHVNFNVETPPSPAPAASATPAATAPEDNDDDDDDGDAKKPSGGDARALAGKIREDVQAGKGKHGEDLGDRISKDLEAKVAAGGGEEKFNREMANNVQQKLSWVALAMLPLFALLLRAMYWRRDSYYFAHLIFSLHYHAFLLLFWTLYMGWALVVRSMFLLRWLEPVDTLIVLVGPGLYLYLALRRVYGGTTSRTVAKVLVIGSIHLLALLIGVASVGALAVFMAGK